MEYPAEVQRVLDEVFIRYTDDDTLGEFNIFHMYPVGLAYPDGYTDSQFFDLWGFNFMEKRKRYLGTHDGMMFRAGANVDIVRIFADGSTLIRMENLCFVDNLQNVVITGIWNA